MQRKDVFFLMVTLAIIISCMTGCGSDDDPTDPTDPTDPVIPDTFPDGVNQLGLYIDTDMSATHVFAGAGTIIDVFFVLKNLYNDQEDRPIEIIGGVEFSITYPHASATIESTIWESGSVINIGDEDNICAAWPTPSPVVDDIVVLGVKKFLLLSDTPFGISVGPFVLSAPSIEGHMVILDSANESLQAIYPTSGAHASPVFGVNIPAKTASFSSF